MYPYFVQVLFLFNINSHPPTTLFSRAQNRQAPEMGPCHLFPLPSTEAAEATVVEVAVRQLAGTTTMER